MGLSCQQLTGEPTHDTALLDGQPRKVKQSIWKLSKVYFFNMLPSINIKIIPDYMNQE
jgi:hypothetical protein